ncbi:hypothetical protein [Streptomyces chattanoogensis]|uniref:hypothetical protein n=1 Tax=Streptomyces chattanoogensis TaxID=66876 RepID=UPI0036857D45
MAKIYRSAATGLLLAAMAGSTLAATASPASASSSSSGWRCHTSYKSIDNPGDWGPAPDNWDFTVKNCIKRQGGSVFAAAKVSWDGPIGGARWDRDPHFRLYVMQSAPGTDRVVAHRDFHIGYALNRHDRWGDHDGSFDTGAWRVRTGKRGLYAGGALKIDWAGDDRGVRHYGFSPSPRV